VEKGKRKKANIFSERHVLSRMKRDKKKRKKNLDKRNCLLLAFFFGFFPILYDLDYLTWDV